MTFFLQTLIFQKNSVTGHLEFKYRFFLCFEIRRIIINFSKDRYHIHLIDPD